MSDCPCYSSAEPNSCINLIDFDFIQKRVLCSGNKLYILQRVSSQWNVWILCFSNTELKYGRYCDQSAPERSVISCCSQAASERIHQTRGWGAFTHTYTHLSWTAAVWNTRTHAGLHACTFTHKHTQRLCHLETLPRLHAHQPGDTYCTHMWSDLFIV